MSIVSLESADEKNVSASILNFLTAYGVISLLSKCGGTKLKGVPVKALFTYTLTNVFRMGNFYMQNKLLCEFIGVAIKIRCGLHCAP